MVRTIIKKTLFSPAMLIAILIMCGGICIGMEGNYDLGLLYSYECAFAMNVAAFFLPFCSVLPVCYIQRYLSRDATSRLMVYRGGRKKYILGNVLNALLAGFLVLLLASLLYALINVLLIGPEGVITGVPAGGAATFEESKGAVEYVKVGYLYESLSDGAYADNGLIGAFPILHQNHLLLFVVEIFLNSMQGAMYSMIALGCYAFIKNQYIAVAFPFLFNRVLAYLAGATSQFWLSPDQLSLDGVMGHTIGGGLVYHFAYWTVVALLFGGTWGIRELRRMRHG